MNRIVNKLSTVTNHSLEAIMHSFDFSRFLRITCLLLALAVISATQAFAQIASPAVLRDDFNTANAALAGRLKWVNITSMPSAGSMSIVTNAIQPTATAGGLYGGILWDSLMSGGTEMGFTIRQKTGGNALASLFLYARMTTKDFNTGSGYRVMLLENTGTDLIELHRIGPGYTNDVILSSVSREINVGDTLTLRVLNDNQTMVVLHNGVNILQTTDAVNSPAQWYFATRVRVNGTAFRLDDFKVSSMVPTPSVTVLTPNGGENWTIGSNQNITWSASLVSNINLYYKTAAAGPWISIANNLSAAAGTYAWTIPNAATTQARVRIEDASNAALNDSSNANFTIAAPPPPQFMPAVLRDNFDAANQALAGRAKWVNLTNIPSAGSMSIVTNAIQPTVGAGGLYGGIVWDSLMSAGSEMSFTIRQKTGLNGTGTLALYTRMNNKDFSTGSGYRLLLIENTGTDVLELNRIGPGYTNDVIIGSVAREVNVGDTLTVRVLLDNQTIVVLHNGVNVLQRTDAVNSAAQWYNAVRARVNATALRLDDFKITPPGSSLHFLVEAQGGGNIGTQHVGSPFNIQVTALDGNNDPDPTFNGTVNITSTGSLSSGSGTTASFVNGVLASHSVTFNDTGTVTITATKTGGSETGTSNTFPVLPVGVPHFLVEAFGGGAIGSQNAETPFNIRVTARDGDNNIDASFNGTVSITSNGTILAGSGTTASFVNGVLASHSVTFSNAGLFSITATETGGSRVGTSNSFQVQAPLLHHFLVEAQGGGPIVTQIANTPFNIRITAQSIGNNTITGFTGTADISSIGILAINGTTPAFVNGVLASHTVMISNIGNFTITATKTGGSESGTSNTFQVSQGVFYSQGNLPVNNLSSWNSSRTGGGATPANFTSGADFVIQNGHSMTTTGTWTITGTGNTIEIETGGTLTATFLVTTDHFQINNGGTYVHNFASVTANGNSNDIPGTLSRLFEPSSNVEIRRWANGGTEPVPLPKFVEWGNLTIDLQDTTGDGWNQHGGLTTIRGNFTLINTGSPDGVIHRYVRLTDTTSFVLTIGGNLTIAGPVGGGNGMNMICCNGNGVSAVINLGGNFIMSGGDFENLTGNQAFNDANQAFFNFTGGQPSVALTHTGGFIQTENISWQVAAGKTLTMSLPDFDPSFVVTANRMFTVNGRLNFAPGATHLLGAGGFVLANGATLGIGSVNGIVTGSGSGNIRLTGPRTFDPGASYEFLPSLAGTTQPTGSGFPSIVNNLTFNNPNVTQGLTLNNSLTVNGALSVLIGKISTGANSITLGPNGSLVESQGKTVVGTVMTTRTVSATVGTETFGNIGSDIVLGGTALGTTTITRRTGTASTGNGNNSILRYFIIQPTTNGGLNAGLTFHYDDTELNGQTASTLELYKSTDAGVTWSNNGGSVNAVARTIAVSGIDDFSRWTASNTSNPLEATPAPSISGINPTNKNTGDTAFTMTVLGTNFFNGKSTIRFNGSNRTTTYISPTELRAQILASDLITAGTFNISVFNTGGGGASNNYPFVVNPGPVHHLIVEKAGGGLIGTQIVNTQLFIQVVAKDSNNNTATGFNSNVSISSNGTLSAGSGLTANFVNGVLASHGVTFSNAGNFSITAATAGNEQIGVSNTFTVVSGAIYYSMGDLPATTLASWNSNRGGGGSSPASFAAGDLFVIENGDSMTTPVAWALSGASNKIQIENGGLLMATNLVTTENFQIDNGGKYYHRVTSALANGTPNDMPGSVTRTFGSSSTVEIQKWGNNGTALVPLPANVAWGNLTINMLDSIAAGWNQLGGLTTINGNFRLQKTGSGANLALHRLVRLTDTTPFTLTIGGDLIINGNAAEGLNLICCSGAGVTFTIAIGGNFIQTGGIFESTTGISGLDNSNNPTVIFGGGSPAVNFTVNSGVNFLSQNINWQVASGKTVTMGANQSLTLSSGRTFTVNGRFDFAAGSTNINGAGNFTVNSGGTIGVGSINGLVLGTASGNIRVSGTRTYNPGANYVFIPSLAGTVQTTGNGFPSVVNNFTFSNTAATQGLQLGIPSLTVNGALTLTTGKITTGDSIIVLGPNGTLSEGAGITVVGKVTTTRNISSTAGTELFGNIGADVTLNGVALGTTTVTRVTGIASTGNGNQSIRRYFDISPTVNTGLNAGFVFHYDNSELNGQNANTLQLYKSTNNGVTWSNQSGTVDISNRTVTASGINGFSRWTASNTSNLLEATPAPTTTDINPTSKTAGDPGFILTVNGTNFVDGFSTVRFNGSDRATVYVGPTQLTASISSSDIATVGSYNITVFNSGGGGTSNAQVLGVVAGPVHHFVVEEDAGGSIPAQVLGNPFGIKITAKDSLNNTATSFNGTVNITSTGTLSAGSGTTAAFVNGVLASHSVTFSNIGNFTITATRTGGTETGTSNAFAVVTGVVNNFLVEAAASGPISQQKAGVAFPIRVTARDAGNNTVTSFTGTVTITSDGILSSGSGTTASFVNGVLASHNLTFSNSGTFSITATKVGGTETGTSNSFVVLPAGSVTYYSQGNLDATQLSSWNTVRGGGGTAPANFTDGDIFVIQNSHVMTTSVPWTLSTGGNKLQIETGGTLNATALVTTDNFQIDSAGTYVHDFHSSTPNGNSGDIPGTNIRSFARRSNVEIRKWANFGPVPVPLPANTSWGNLIINISDWVAGGSSEHVGWNMQGTLTSIQGDFRVLHTGSPDQSTHKFIRLTDATSFTLTIGGDLVIDGNPGEGLNMICCTGDGITATIKIGGSFIQQGGYFESNTGFGNLNDANTARVIFTGGVAGTDSFVINGGTFVSDFIDWQVDTGKVMQINDDIDVTGGRTFTISGRANFAPTAQIDGAGNFAITSTGIMGITHPNGIDTGTTVGHVQVSGTRSFNAGASYEFLPAGPYPLQLAGASFPATVRNLTLSNPTSTQGVILGSNLTVTGTLQISEGKLQTGTNTITLGAGATLIEGSAGRVIVGRVTTTRNPGVTTGTVTFGNIGADVTLGGVAMGNTTVTRTTGLPAQTYTSRPAILRYFDITPATNTGLNATLIFHYDSTELNNQIPANLRLLKSTNSGTSWTPMGGTVNVAARTITLPGQSGFSRWTAIDTVSAPAPPTAGDTIANPATLRDNFNRSDTALAGRFKWANLTNAPSNTSMAIVSNAIQPVGDIGATYGAVVWDSLMQGGSEMSVTILQKPNTNDVPMLFLYGRMNNKDYNTGTGYRFSITEQSGPDLLEIHRIGPGYINDVTIGATNWEVNPGDVVTFRVLADNQTMIALVNNLVILKITDAANNPSQWYFALRARIAATAVRLDDFKISVPKTFAVLTPNGGEVLTATGQSTITWIALGISQINLSYKTTPAGAWTTIQNNVAAASGSFIWTVPNTTSTQARVRIVNSANAAQVDSSNNFFTIAAPEAIASPAVLRDNFNTADVPLAGRLKWANITNATGSASMAIVSNAIQPTNTGGNGTYGGVVWDTLMSGGTEMTVTVLQKANTIGVPMLFMYARMNNKDFNTGTGYRLAVREDAGLDMLEIQRVGPGYGNDVAVVASLAREIAVNDMITFRVLNNNQTMVVLINGVIVMQATDVTNTPAQWYFGIRGRLNTTALRLDDFKVSSQSGPAPFAVTAPNGGQVWQATTSQNITWSAPGASQVNLLYKTAPASAWIVIQNNVSAALGTFAWTVPNTPTTQARVQVVNSANAAQADSSDNFFTISAPPPPSTIANPAILRDNFNAANAPLAGRLKWVNITNVPAGGSMSINTNAMQPTTTTNTVGEFGAIVWDTLMGAGTEMGFTLRQKSGLNATSTAYFYLRMNNKDFTTGTGYRVAFKENTGTDAIELHRVGPGYTNDVLLQSATREVNVGDTITVRVLNDNRTMVVLVNGTNILQRTDSTNIPAQWYFAVRARISPTPLRLDDFKVSTRPAAAKLANEFETMPKEFVLSQNYPNPFNPTTTIGFGLATDAHVQLDVFNVLGQHMMTLVDEDKSAGYYRIEFSAQNIPSGTYFYRIRAGELVQTRKFTIMK